MLSSCFARAACRTRGAGADRRSALPAAAPTCRPACPNPFGSLQLAAGSHRFGADPAAGQSSAVSCRNIRGRRPVSVFGCCRRPFRRRNPIPAASPGVSGGGRGLASYAPPSHRPLETTGSVAPRSVARPVRDAGGTHDHRRHQRYAGDIWRSRYHVSPAAIMQANGYKGPRTLSPGQQLIIPHPTASAAAPAPPVARSALGPEQAGRALAPPSVHVVNHGDTLLSIARRNHVSVHELAKSQQSRCRPPSSSSARGLSCRSKVAAAAPGSRRRRVAAAPAPSPRMPAATRVARCR